MTDRKLRHELKYVISVHEGEAFLREVLPFCRPDTHAGADSSYEVVSVYYDTTDLRFYRDREESVGHRRKIRLRTYNHCSAPPILFYEIKEKHKNFVGKKRCDLPNMHLVTESEEHHRISLDHALLQMPDTAAAREMAYLHHRLGLHPIVMIRYIRKALMATCDFDLRITLDKRLTAGGSNLLAYQENTERYILPPEEGILELKSNHCYPLWLQQVLRRFGFRQVRFSKYCAAVQNMSWNERYFAVTRSSLEAQPIEVRKEARDNKTLTTGSLTDSTIGIPTAP